jgi:hypothetical protein
MDPIPDPTPDPTSFFSDFKDAKSFIFSYFFKFFSYKLPTGTISSVFKNLIFCLNFVGIKLFFASIISVISTHYEKGYLVGFGSVPLTNGSGSPTLVRTPAYYL